jgi:T-complex protein 1 subunit gamma
VALEEQGRKEIDLKQYAKVWAISIVNSPPPLPLSDLNPDEQVEKIPGGELEDSRVLRGVMLNKDVTHATMRRRYGFCPFPKPPSSFALSQSSHSCASIERPRVLLLDCGLEYTKGESKTDAEVRWPAQKPLTVTRTH